MNTDRNCLYATLGTAYLFGTFACLGKGSLKACSGMSLSGAAFGYGLYGLAPIVANELTLKTQACFSKAQKGFVGVVGEENIPPPYQALEFFVITALVFLPIYHFLEAGFFNASCLSIGGLFLWVAVKHTFVGEDDKASALTHPANIEKAQWVKDHIKELQKTAFGIQNGGNDCFLNAAFQMILHSPLIEIILNEDSSIDIATKKGKFINNFIQQCYLYGNKKQLPTSNWARSILGFDTYSQGDASEAFLKIVELFNTKSLEWEITWNRNLLNTKVPIESKTESESIVPDKALLIQIFPPKTEKDISLQMLLDSWTKKRDMEDKSRQVPESSTAHMVEEVVITQPQDHLFCSFNRYDLQRNKLNYAITADSFLINIHNNMYDLRSFICHSELMGDGHYIAYCKLPEKEGEPLWHCFNDSKVTQISEKEALEKLQGATVGHFVKAQ